MWSGAVLGAIDDRFSGQPFGSAILLWSLAMLVLEFVEARFPWRGFWQDWLTAGLASACHARRGGVSAPRGRHSLRNRSARTGGHQIGRAHVCTPVTNAHLVCRLLLEKKNTHTMIQQ